MSDEPVPSARVRGGVPAFGGAPGGGDLPEGVTVIPTYPLYSPGQAAGATFLGGPLAGSWVLAANYRRLGALGKARAAIVLGIVATIALLALVLALSDLTPTWLAIVPVLAVSSIARSLQGAAYQRHLAVGGSRGSTWRVVGIGVASIALTIGAGIGYGYASAPDEVQVGKIQVLYTNGATRAEAQAVGEQLAQVFTARPVTIEVREDRGRHVVAFVVQEIAFGDDRVQDGFRAIAADLSAHVFSGAPVDVWLCDDMLEPHRRLIWRDTP